MSRCIRTDTKKFHNNFTVVLIRLWNFTNFTTTFGTFAPMKKTIEVNTNSKVVQFSTQDDFFGKISLIQQNRKVDLKDVFCYPRGLVP